VIFTSLRTEGDHGYAQTSDEMMALAARQPGYLGVESARGADGLGITVSYWRDMGAIRAWKAHADHLAASAPGASGGTAPTACGCAGWSASTGSRSLQRQLASSGSLRSSAFCAGQLV
jgi:heme-degrading monooxygenase HmoA